MLRKREAKLWPTMSVVIESRRVASQPACDGEARERLSMCGLALRMV